MPFKKGQSGNPKGRPRTTEKHAGAIAKAEQQIADRLPERVERLHTLANGGYERVEETWAPAGTLWHGSGEYARRMYPDRDPSELIMIKRTVSIAEPDRAANQYLIDRIAGKPTERQEVTGDGGGPIEVTDARDRLARLITRRLGAAPPGGDPGDPSPA